MDPFVPSSLSLVSPPIDSVNMLPVLHVNLKIRWFTRVNLARTMVVNVLGVSYFSNTQGSTLRLTNRDISSSNESVRRPTHLVDRRDLVDHMDAFA